MKIFVLILVIVILVALLIASGVFMLKMYKKMKAEEALLDKAMAAIDNASKVLDKAVSDNVQKLEKKINSIVDESKKDVNKNSETVGIALINGGFNKVN